MDFGSIFDKLNAVASTYTLSINPSIILNLTNFGMDTYLHCQDIVNAEKKDYEKIRYLDSKVRKMDIFDIL